MSVLGLLRPLGRRDGDVDDDEANEDARVVEGEQRVDTAGNVRDVNEGRDCDVDDDGLLRLSLLGAPIDVSDEEASSKGPSLDGPGLGSMRVWWMPVRANEALKQRT